MKKNKIIGAYKNGNYHVFIGTDGTKTRFTDDDDFKPAFSECADVKITRKCQVMCPFCYENCTPTGKHSDIMSQKWIHSLHPYTEIAINGNDMDHPQLDDFLTLMAEQKVIVNITVNQAQFRQNYARLCSMEREGLVHGIGVSLNYYDEELHRLLASFPNKENVIIHVISGIFCKEDFNMLKDKGLKVLVLGYKDVRRGRDYKFWHDESVGANMKWLYDNILSVRDGFSVVSFDNLAIDQLELRRIFSAEEWERFYMGDDGMFSFYIDAVGGTFAKNSVISETENFPIEDMTIDEMFGTIREKYKK